MTNQNLDKNAYNNINNKNKRRLRRQRQQRRRAFAVLLTLCMIMTGVLSYHALTSKANENETLPLKYYTGVIVKSGDTLWTIADNYIDYEQYRSKQAYIDEVCSINNLYEESDIHPGQRLIVPYFSEEFKY